MCFPDVSPRTEKSSQPLAPVDEDTRPDDEAELGELPCVRTLLERAGLEGTTGIKSASASKERCDFEAVQAPHKANDLVVGCDEKNSFPVADLHPKYQPQAVTPGAVRT